MSRKGYTCMYCNRWYLFDDPRFDYWRLDKDGNPLDGKDGRRRESHGWFARCVDQEDCARARRANHAGLNYEQLELA